MRPILGPLVVALAWPMVAVAGGPEATGEASFDYELGSHAWGRVEGSCQGSAFFLREDLPGRMRFQAGGGQWARQVTEFNYTVLRPQNPRPFGVGLSASTWLTREPVPSGPAEIRWGETGDVRLFAAPGPLASSGNTFRADFNASQLKVEPFSRDLPGSYFKPYRSDRLQDAAFPPVVRVIGGVAGWNRFVQPSDGFLRLSGDLTFYLEDAEVHWDSGFERSLPPHLENVTQTPDNPVAAYWRFRLHNAFLTVSNASLEVPASSGALLCKGLQARVDGVLTAWRAAGNVTKGTEAVAFSQQELQIRGRFDWMDSPRSDDPGEPGVARAWSRGMFSAVGIDFAEIATTQSVSFEQVGLWATVLALVAASWWAVAKWLLPLFSRLGPQEVENQPTRRALLDLVGANPGIAVQPLSRQLGLPESNARYHLQLLETRGEVSSHKVGGERRYWGRSHGRILPGDLFGEFDRAVGLLAQRSAPSGLRQAEAMRLLQAELRISRNAAYKAVLRAQRHGVVRRVEGADGVWIWPA